MTADCLLHIGADEREDHAQINVSMTHCLATEGDVCFQLFNVFALSRCLRLSGAQGMSQDQKDSLFSQFQRWQAGQVR